MLLPKYTVQSVLIIGLISATHGAFYYPNPQASLLEHILVDTHGAHRSGFADAITPCSNYVSGSQNFGRETAAQWIRVAFHDFVTAHVVDGVGGIDASIGFETLREEDSGSAFNDSFAFFRPYVNSRVSMADLVAISVSMSVGNCGGPQIPVRGGRIDASEGGAFGVPAPETEIDLTLEFFANAGFNQVDAIGLTACGHTLGSVHHGGFPTVVGPEAVTPSNTAGGIHFDSTVAIFDTDVLGEYLEGIGNAGGPLVTSFNISSRSDLRLYESDNNVTMTKLRDSGSGFFDTCATLLQRMIETVPSVVVLSDIVSPLTIKPVNATLDFDLHGMLIFTGSIRILAPPGSFPPDTLTLTTFGSNKAISLTPESDTGTSIFGNTSYYPFSTSIPQSETFNSFTIAGAGVPTTSFAVQTSAFVVPSLTSITVGANTGVNFTAAILPSNHSSSLSPTIRISAPVPQMGTLGPAIAAYENVAVAKIGKRGAYDLWHGSLDLGEPTTGAVTIEILQAGNVVDTLLVGLDEF